MEIKHVEKNQDTGENEIMLVLSNSELKLLKAVYSKAFEDKVGLDVDDEEQMKTAKDIREFLLDCKNKLNPS